MNVIIIDYELSARTKKIAEDLHDAGAVTTVITARYTVEQKRDYRSKFLYELQNNVQYIYVCCNTIKSEKQHSTKGLFGFINTIRSGASHIAGRYKPDIIICASAFCYDIYAAEKIADFSGGKIITELFEIHHEDIGKSEGIGKFNLNRIAAKMAFKKSTSRSDLLVCVSPYIKDYLLGENITFKKCIYIPNGIKYSDFEFVPPTHSRAIENVLKSGMFVVMFVGALTEGTDISAFACSGALCSEDVKLVVVGDGPRKLALKEFAKNEKIDILFLDGVSKEKLALLLQMAHCLYVDEILQPDHGYSINIGRILEYVHGKRPIIYSACGCKNPLEQCDCGLCTTNSPTGIADAIERLKAMPRQQLDDMGEQLKKRLFAEFDEKQLFDSYMCELLRLVGDGENKG